MEEIPLTWLQDAELRYETPSRLNHLSECIQVSACCMVGFIITEMRCAALKQRHVAKPAGELVVDFVLIFAW